MSGWALSKDSLCVSRWISGYNLHEEKKMDKNKKDILKEFTDKYAIDSFGIPEEYQGEDPEEETLISLSEE